MTEQDLFDRLKEDVRHQAREARVDPARAFIIFLGAYQKHKNQHGSFKNHPEYTDAMTGRYHYMHNKAIEYIQAEVAKRQAAPASN
jgi:hypothetical protein